MSAATPSPSSSSSSRKYNATAATDSTVLSEIYRTLGQFAAEIEIDDSVFDHKGDVADEHLAEDERSYFRSVESDIETLLVDGGEALDAESIMRVFSDLRARAQMQEKDRDALLEAYKQATRRRVKLNEEKFKLKNANDLIGRKIEALKEACRTAQAANKSLQEDGIRLKERFIEQLAATRSSMEDSIGSIDASVCKEEQNLASAREANNALREKVEAFRAHLLSKRERLNTISKTKEIEKQLLAARHAQYNHVLQSLLSKEDSYGEHVTQLLERKLKLMQQSQHYSEMTQLFEKTLGESQGLFGDFDAKKQLLIDRAVEAKAANARSVAAHKALDKEIERLVQERAAADREAEQQAALLLADQERCRQLLAGQKK